MSLQECGISHVPTERKSRLPFPQIRKTRDELLKEGGLQIAYQITSTFIIIQNGDARIFREHGGKLVIHPFESLPEALDQCERVIQKKLGFQRRIGEVFINIAGENEELVKIGAMLLTGADEYYSIPFPERKTYAKRLADEAKELIREKRNIYKQTAEKTLQIILEADDEFRDDAKELLKAGKNVFDAAIDGVKIVNGETIRLVNGQLYFEDCGSRSLKIFERLAGYHEQLKNLNETIDDGDAEAIRERKRLTKELGRKFKEEGPFWRAIEGIKPNPFFKRLHSHSVNSLIRLPWAMTTGRFKDTERLLAKAVTELSALERDYERGMIRLLPTKSTANP